MIPRLRQGEHHYKLSTYTSSPQCPSSLSCAGGWPPREAGCGLGTEMRLENVLLGDLGLIRPMKLVGDLDPFHGSTVAVSGLDEEQRFPEGLSILHRGRPP